MAKADLTAQQVRDLFTYDPETGVLSWRVSRGWNIPAGMRAGTRTVRGYRKVAVNRGNYKEHRLIWLHYYGVWPTFEVDHINGVKDDNRIANLRDINPAHNTQNRTRPSANNSTGYLGVTKKAKGKTFTAAVELDGKSYSKSGFATAEEAYEAYVALKRRLHPGCTI